MNPVLREITAAFMFVIMGVQSVAAQAPIWWAEQHVIVPEAAPDDYAIINQGQLKALASAAYRAMQDRLEGGAGATVSSLVESWQQPTLNTDDFSVVTAGQLKKTAKPFYDRMNQVLGTSGYPWSSATTADDYSVVNIGQAKKLFAFNIPRSTPTITVPPLPGVNAFVNTSTVSPLGLTVSQTNWPNGQSSTSQPFNVTDISTGDDGNDPSHDVFWDVAKVELTNAQEATRAGQGVLGIDDLLSSRWQLGKKKRAETDQYIDENCHPVDPEITSAAQIGIKCACQHGTANVYRALFSSPPDQGFWDRISGGSPTEKCENRNNVLKWGYVAIRIRVNNPVAEGAPVERLFKVTTHHPVWGESSYEEGISIVKTATSDGLTGSTYYMAPPGGWVELEAVDSAEDADPAPLSISDAAGPRYRKVGLNGIPMPDAKPQVQNENGEENEETYIDAFSAQIRHSVSDVYVTDAATLLPLAVRRDVSSDSWNNRYGLRPNERPCQPFGAGWSSNVCSYVRFTYSEDAITAEVVDEMGATQRFVQVDGRWYHDGQEARDMKSYQNELVTPPPGYTSVNVNGTSVNVMFFNTLQLKKKFGTTCEYQMVDPAQMSQFLCQDRKDHKGTYTVHVYARLHHVTDRLGNRLDYEYPFTNTLIPERIHDPARPGHQILLQQSDGHVTAVRGPGGDLITYQYEVQQEAVPNAPAGEAASALPAWALTSVTKNFNAAETLGSDVVSYNYTLDQVYIPDDRDAVAPGNTDPPKPVIFANFELASIMDERGGVYSFTHERNESVFSFTGKVDKVVRSQPMTLTSVTLPNQQVTSLQTTNLNGVSFNSTNNRRFPYPSGGALPGVRLVITPPFTGAAASAPKYTYEFKQPEWIPLIGLTSNPNTVSLGYKIMKITAPDGGVESYFYDGAEVPAPTPPATRPTSYSMVLTCVRDRNNKETRFVYGDKPSRLVDGVLTLMPFSFDDPTQEITTFTAPGIANRDIVKTMTYHAASRILLKTAVKRNATTEITTTYGIDGLFRRTSETSEGKIGVIALPGGSKKALVYGHTAFPGFVTSETVDSATTRTASATVPSLAEVPKVTKDRSTEASDPGNPAWWRTVSETVTIGNPTSLTGTALQNLPPSETKTWSDFNGNKLMVRDARGHVTEFQYDGRHRLIKVIHPDSTFKTLAYDAHGNLIRETDELGTATFHEYDVLNRRTKTTFDLNRNGQADARYTSVSVNGMTTTYNGDLVTDTTYNHFNLPVTQMDPRGIVTLHEYDNLGRLIQTIVNASGAPAARQVTRYADTNPATVDFTGGSVFDVSGFKPLRVIDPRGFVTTFEYDSLYRQIRETRPDGGIIHKTYDDTGLLLSVSEPTQPGITPATNITTTVYNAQGQPQLVTYADGLKTETYYTPSGQPWKTTDETGLVTRINYNAAGMPVRTIVMSGASEMLHPNTLTTYDLAGNPRNVTDPRGNVTQQIHNERNRVVQVIAPQVLDAAATPPVTVSPATVTAYDALGRVTAVTDPLGAVTQKVYDPAGRVTAVIDALNQTSQMSYNQAGAILTTTNALNQTTTNVYDELGRLITTTDAAGIANQFGYDLAGNRTSVKDGLNRETTFVYDAFSRLTTQTFANGDAWSYSYFTPQVGAVAANYLDKASQTDPAGRVTTFTYDKRHRLKTMVRTKATSGPENYLLEATYTYGTIVGVTAGRLTSVTNKTLGASVGTAGPVATIVATSYTYDKQGRVITEVSNGQTHSYGYDQAGNRTTSTLDCGSVSRVILTNYDALNRPISIVDNNATTTPTTDDLTTSYGYDLAGRALTLQQANGQKTLNAYDAVGRLKGRVLKSGANVPQATFAWLHDAIGSVTQQNEVWAAAGANQPARTRSTTNTYDAANRLATETIAESGSATVTTTNTYDAAHNRTHKLVVGGAEAGDWSYFYNSVNQLKSTTMWGGVGPPYNVVYNYDANGNRILSSRINGSQVTPDVTTYQWNAWDKLIGVNLPDGNKHSYTYDYRTRRVGVAQAALGTQKAKYTAVTFSGGLSVAEFESATVTVGTVPAVQYIRGPDMGGGVGGLLRTVRNPVSSSTGLPIAPTNALPLKLKYNLSNGRGDIVAQSDSTGALTWTASYEAYGKRTKETGANADKQRANSKDEDPTGLLNEGFRYRDIETGVWLSRDPAGFVDGPNLYAFVKQNPWTKFDPDGLLLLDVSGPLIQAAIRNAQTLPTVSAPVPGAMMANSRVSGNPTAAMTTAFAPLMIQSTATAEGRVIGRGGAQYARDKGYITQQQYSVIGDQIDKLQAPEVGMYQGGPAKVQQQLADQSKALIINAMTANAQSPKPIAAPLQTSKVQQQQNDWMVLQHYTNQELGNGNFYTGSYQLTSANGLDAQSASQGLGIPTPTTQYSFRVKKDEVRGPLPIQPSNRFPYTKAYGFDQWEVVKPFSIPERVIDKKIVPKSK